MSEEQIVSVLSIDAWADGEDGWNWNAWYKVGSVDLAEIDGLDDLGLIAWFYDNGFTTSKDPTLCTIDDDQYNKVICEAATGMPVFAIAYGEVRS